MCTAITFSPNEHYFGRNLDLEYTYQEAVTITPRQFPLPFRRVQNMHEHYAMIGMATVADGYPLYYDATNEHALSMAGLNFPGNAIYMPEAGAKHNIAPFEFIPYVLAQCKTVCEAMDLINNTNLADICFSNEYPLTPLHWIIADPMQAITVEPTTDGIKIYQNPVGVLTNSPKFDYHLQNLVNYINITAEEAENRFSDRIDLQPYSNAMGAMGLPGDLSSSSRFVRAAFTKLNSIFGKTPQENISQFFHILASVSQQKGCVRLGDKYERTVYTSCCNTLEGIYYYNTYENNQICQVNMHHEDLGSNTLISYPIIREQNIHCVN